MWNIETTLTTLNLGSSNLSTKKGELNISACFRKNVNLFLLKKWSVTSLIKQRFVGNKTGGFQPVCKMQQLTLSPKYIK
jgi:hypothetical protein